MHVSQTLLLLLAAVVAMPLRGRAQETASLVGAWEGTSVCLVNRGVCNDEHVIYHVTPADTADSVDYEITMNKVVGGQEEDADPTVLGCRVSGDRRTLTCPMPPQFRPATWSFTRQGDALSGWLTAPDGTHLRRIELRAAGSPPAEAPPPSASTTQSSAPAASRVDIAAVERGVMDAVNRYRESKGLPLLRANTRVTTIARRHSEAAARGQVALADGQGHVRARAIATTMPVQTWAEDVVMGRAGDDDAAARLAEQLIAAARANIENAAFEDVGIGIARDDTGRYFLTQMLVLSRAGYRVQ
jgi:hypothetical protein